jgi:adenine-specific DNA methylase
MAIRRAEKEKLMQAKRAEIQKLLYEKDLLIDQRQSSNKIMGIESKISSAKSELEKIEALLETDSTFETQVIINGGNAQISTGISVGDFIQNNSGHVDFWNTINFDDLEKELSSLHQAMKKQAKTDEHDIALGEIVKAKKAVREKKREKILQALQSAGKWAFDVATKIGTTLAAEALKIALGLK